MSASKLTSKFQATIPKEIRDKLKLKKGDLLIFQIVDRNVLVLKKSTPFDKEYLRALSKTLNEWNSSDDEAAYEHLKDI
jgi:AbrB family looped-hinge helix DNA binding protein